MKKLLALNRSEIAIRILRAANELGLRTVAIYSQEDRLALHRFKADEAYLIGEGKGPVEAYLDVDGIVASGPRERAWMPSIPATVSSPRIPPCRAPASAPASPSSDPARSCWNCSATRPPPATSPKRPASRWCPAPEAAVSDPREAEQIAAQIGFPLIVKAAFGGGGRGMRVVDAPADFAGRLEEARREAAAAFGNDAVFLERYIRRARHIEVQILGDRHGNILHLYERDCSVQRRHQKVVEVAPAREPRPPPSARALADAAVTLARSRRLLQRRHRRVPGGRRLRRVVLHRGQSAHPGGAHRHRNGDRHRPGALPDPDRPGHSICTAPKSTCRRRIAFRCTATPCSAASPPRTRPTTSCPITARISHLPLARRLRHPPGWRLGLRRRRHHALLRFAAGENHRLGPRVPPRLPAHGPRACASSACAA